MRSLIFSALAFAVLLGTPVLSFSEELKGTAAEELKAIKRIFEINPGFAIDTTRQSGTYCMNVGFGRGGHMTHYSTTPLETTNDIIDFIDARPLIAAGLDGTKFPKLPKEAGKLTPGQWYFLPEGEFEPYHGRAFPIPMIIKAVDVN